MYISTHYFKQHLPILIFSLFLSLSLAHFLSLEVVSSDDFLEFFVQCDHLWDLADPVVVPLSQVGQLLLTQLSPRQVDHSADLAVVLQVGHCQLIATEILLALELLVQTGQKTLEKVLLLPGQFSLVRGSVTESLWRNDHA